jgi:hypothetical protein
MINLSRIQETVASLVDENAKAKETQEKNQRQAAQDREDLAKQIGNLNETVRDAIFDSFEATGHTANCILIGLDVFVSGIKTSGLMRIHRDGAIDYDWQGADTETISQDQFFDGMGATTVEGVKKLAEAIEIATLKLINERKNAVEDKDNPFV